MFIFRSTSEKAHQSQVSTVWRTWFLVNLHPPPQKSSHFYLFLWHNNTMLLGLDDITDYTLEHANQCSIHENYYHLCFEAHDSIFLTSSQFIEQYDSEPIHFTLCLMLDNTHSYWLHDMKALISEPLDEITLAQSDSNQESLQATPFNIILQS